MCLGQEDPEHTYCNIPVFYLLTCTIICVRTASPPRIESTTPVMMAAMFQRLALREASWAPS